VSGASTTGNQILYNSITDNDVRGISLELGGNFNIPPPLMVNVDALQANGIVTDTNVVPPGSRIHLGDIVRQAETTLRLAECFDIKQIPA